jgi:hypothetical protein
MKKIFLINLLIGVTFINCQKEITIAQPSYTSKVSIQGLIEPDSVPIVYVNKTVPYFSNTTNTAELVLRNATVKIIDNNHSDILKLDSLFDKIYCKYIYYFKGNAAIKINTNYTLEITNGSDVYTASTTTIIAPAIVDSVNYTPLFNDLYGAHEGVIVYFKDIPSQTNYFRYQMERYVDTTIRLAGNKQLIFCLGNDSIKTLELGRSVYDDKNVDGQQIKIVVEPAYTHSKGVQTFVRMQSISFEAYDFYSQLDNQKLAQFNPFVEPVFLRDGQFGKKAIGFFGCKVLSNRVSFTFPE